MTISFHKERENIHGKECITKRNGQNQVNLDNLVEKNKDLDPTYVKNKLKEYNELLQYYSILHTKEQMDDSNVELDEWWELVEAQFHEEMQKNMVEHKRDG